MANQVDLKFLFLQLPFYRGSGNASRFYDKSIHDILIDQDLSEIRILKKWLCSHLTMTIAREDKLTPALINAAFKAFGAMGVKPTGCKYIPIDEGDSNAAHKQP